MTKLELLTTSEMAEADRLSMVAGVSGMALMERAGTAVADCAAALAPEGRGVVVLCGPGNNGGDGFIAARVLRERGLPVRLHLLGEAGRLRGDAAEAARRWAGPIEPCSALELEPAGLVVDGLFGAGLSRDLDGEARALVELELKGGRRSGLFAFARKLTRAAPVSLSLISKGERGYQLAAGTWGAPVKMTPPTLGTTMSAAEAFTAIAHGCLRQMMLNAPAFDLGQEIEAVHQTRVAIRRLRAALALFRPIIDDAAYPQLSNDLKWLSDHLGDTRDIDVLLTETLEPALVREPGAPGLTELAAFIATRQASSRKVLREAMNSQRGRKLMLDLLLWVEDGAWRRKAIAAGAEPQSLKDLLDRRLRGSRKKLAALGEHMDTLTEEELHELRIRAKKLRYQAAFFDTLASDGKAARRFNALVNALEQIQESLGAVHDAEATAAFLEDQARTALQQGESHDPLMLFAAGRLAGAHPDREALVARAGKALTKALATKPFWTKL